MHVNGWFTEPIRLERGVRQGYLMSTLLFVISTQPLMEMVKEKAQRGELEGIQVGQGR